MPIIFEDPPADGMALIRRHVPYLLAADGITDVFDGAHKPFRVARPQPIYTTTAQNVLDGSALDGARLSGWQYVILTDDAVFATAEIGDKEGEMMFTVLRFQAYSRPVADALHTAEELPEIAAADYELRILRSPDVDLRALWLHGPADILIPIARVPTGIHANVTYGQEALTQALRPLASRRSEHGLDPATEFQG
jgi:hypothetical protein